MNQVVGGRGRGHFLPKPVFWAILGLFFPSFSPMTGDPEGRKKGIERAKSAAAAAEFPTTGRAKMEFRSSLPLTVSVALCVRLLAYGLDTA